MKRREFVTLIGGGALAWPFAVSAQQALPMVGILHEGLPAPLSLTTAFLQGLNEGGVRQDSVKIENRWAEGQYNRLPALAAELIDKRVNIIVAAYLVAARAAEAATQMVPIIFITGSDPIAAGLVSSLNQPTGNATGIAFMFTRSMEKNLATLHELVPNALVIGALVNPNNSNVEPQLHDLRAAASGFGLQIVALLARDENEIDRVFETLTQQKIQARLVTADGFFFGLQDKLATLAARYGLPAFDYLHGNVARQVSPTNTTDAGSRFDAFAMRTQVTRSDRICGGAGAAPAVAFSVTGRRHTLPRLQRTTD